MFEALKHTLSLRLIIPFNRIISYGFNTNRMKKLLSAKIHSAVSDPIGCHTTVSGSLCSPVMCLLKWKRVIEWDNLKTQGLGLLLATIVSEERRFSHCLLSLFLRANTQTLTCTQKYVNPFWKQSTYSDTQTAALPQPTSQAIDNKYWTVYSAQKETNTSYTNWISVSWTALFVHSQWVMLVDLSLTRFEFKISVFMISFPCMPPIWTH